MLIILTVPSASPPFISAFGGKPRWRAETLCRESSALHPVPAAWTAPVLPVGNGTAWEELVWLKAAAELSPKHQVDTA